MNISALLPAFSLQIAYEVFGFEKNAENDEFLTNVLWNYTEASTFFRDGSENKLRTQLEVYRNRMNGVKSRIVRDRMPALISGEGRDCEYRLLPDETAHSMIFERMSEFAYQARNEKGMAVVTALAEIRELMDRICAMENINQGMIAREQDRLTLQQGNYANSTLLLWSS